jgi:5-exo-hydroxycamphor dehydrogenase
MGWTDTMRYAALAGPGRVDILEMAVPPSEPGGIVVRVLCAGVCGTDVHRYRGELGDAPMALGHEGVGVVTEMGAGVTTDAIGRPLVVGDRVSWAPGSPCHRCYSCAVLGDMAACERRTWPIPPGVASPATFAEYAWLPAGTSFARVEPTTPSDAVIAFGCALPSALQGLERLGSLGPDDRVVVQGCGPVGIAATFLARRCGASVVVVGEAEGRRSHAARFGAVATIGLDSSADERAVAIREVFGGRRPTVVIEAAGHLDAFPEAVDLLGSGGRLLVLGLWADQGPCPVAPHVINNKNLTIVGSAFAQPRHYFRALELVEAHHAELPFAESVTHRFTLERCEDALGVVADGTAIKAVLVPHDD